MKKADVINLIKYHYEQDSDNFYKQSFAIAKEFYESGDQVLAQYIESVLSSKFNLVPQGNEGGSFFEEVNTRMPFHLFLPDEIDGEINGVINAIHNNRGINKFLFSGLPGTGKTETAKYIANAVNRKLLSISFTGLIDSRLGETPKNIERMFSAINNTYDASKYIFLFDEIDVIALDRINRNDVREMGRATSLFIKSLDRLNPDAVIIATTNLGDALDKAIKRRFDYMIDFNCYTKSIMGEISINMVKEMKTSNIETGELKMIQKFVENSIQSFSPAELRNFIKISLAFSDPNDYSSFFKRLFVKLYSTEYLNDIAFLKNHVGLTVREIERLTGIPKSNISRMLNNGEN